MNIEHLGLQVADPAVAATWYGDHLGFTIRRAIDSPFPVRFLADSSGRVMLEIYRNPSIAVPDHASMDPLELHVAFVCDDVDTTTKRLVAAGASIVSGPSTTPAGDRLAMLRDPWGVPIQLCCRSVSMV
jgi:glyoxylase I family protein